MKIFMGKRGRAFSVLGLVLLLLAFGVLPVGFAPVPAYATTTLEVGPGYAHPNISSALAAAVAGDTIKVYPGVYLNENALATIEVPNLEIIGVKDGNGNYPQMTVSQGFRLPNRKGIWRVAAKHVTINGFGFTGAVDPDQDDNNWAGIRMDVASDLWIVNCEFYENNMGILTSEDRGGDTDLWDLHVVGCDFHHSAVNGEGYAHNIYIGHLDEFHLVDSFSHQVRSEGHLLKSRASKNYIINSLLMDGTNGETFSNSLIDIPEAGELYVIGSVLQEGVPGMGNDRLLSYGDEGYNGGGRVVNFINNTIVNQRTDGSHPFRFKTDGAALNLVFKNNLFTTARPDDLLYVDGQNVSDQYFKVEDGNFKIDASLYADYSNYDYRLATGASVIDKGVVYSNTFTSATTAYASLPAKQPGIFTDKNAVTGRALVGAIDPGAYEYDPNASTSSPQPTVPLTRPISKADLSYISGQDRVQTSVAISRLGWQAAETVILAPGGSANLIDALAVAPLAAQADAPILLSTGGRLDTAVITEIKRLGAKNAILVGALSDDIRATLTGAIPGIEIKILKGIDRWETANLVGAQVRDAKGTVIVGYNAIADAVSIAPWAAANGYIIQPAAVDGTISAALGGSHGYILGGQQLVRDVPGFTRLYGADRYATNRIIRENLTFAYTNIYTANGNTLVDALTGSVLAAKTQSAIVLTPAGDPTGVDFGQITAETKVFAFGGGL
jgi:hypothetical protein